MTSNSQFSEHYIQQLRFEIIHYKHILQHLHKSCLNKDYDKIRQYCELEKSCIAKLNSLAYTTKRTLPLTQWQNQFSCEMETVQQEQEAVMEALVLQRDTIKKKLQEETKLMKKLRIGTQQKPHFLDIQC